MKRMRTTLVSVFLALIPALHAHAVASMSVHSSVVANGGGPIQNADCRIAGTVGQPVVGLAASSSYILPTGFWHLVAKAFPFAFPEAAVGEKDKPGSRPASYALFQNTPNPFNPLTIISYDLPEASEATLTIHTIAGQKVAVLVDRHQEAGRQTVLFDGSRFASGIYIYRLQAGQSRQARRMLLLK